MRELLVISIGSCRYGVWKDEVLSRRRIQGIHWLPMSPECFSGVAELGERTTTLFDLSVCLGHGSFDRRLSGEALILSEDPRPGGFVYAEESETVEVDPEGLLPMPGFLNSEEFEGCVVCSGEPVIVIDISLLYRRAMGPEWKSAGFLPAVTAPPLEPFGVRDVRLFEVSGELFAVPSPAVEEETARPGPIRPLPLAPPYVEGLCLHEGRIRAVISFARRMGLEGENRGLLLFAREGDFAILAGSGAGKFRLESGPLPMPPLARTDSAPFAVAREGAIIPLINAPALIRADGDLDLGGAYRPRSKFASLFGKRQVKVCEFSASGMTLVVPDSQVEDVTGFKAIRRMENLHPMVRGIAMHDGRILPVLDLALCFGRRVEAGPASKMIYLRNGSFEVLLLADTVFGRRTLSVPEQRELPLNLPHQFVYGCYTVENEVRLILNVEALAVHFDREIVSEYFETIARETSSPVEDISKACISEQSGGADFEGNRLTSEKAVEEEAVSSGAYPTAGNGLETTGPPVPARTTGQVDEGAPSPEAPNITGIVDGSAVGESGACKEGEGGLAPLAPVASSSAEAPEIQEPGQNPDEKTPLNENQQMPGNMDGSDGGPLPFGQGKGGKALAGLPPAEGEAGGVPQETQETKRHEIGSADVNALRRDEAVEQVPAGDRGKPPFSRGQAQTALRAPEMKPERTSGEVENGPLPPPASKEKESISIGLSGLTEADSVSREQHPPGIPDKRGRWTSLRWMVYSLIILASVMASYLAFVIAPGGDDMRAPTERRTMGDSVAQDPSRPFPVEGEPHDAKAGLVDKEKDPSEGEAAFSRMERAETPNGEAAKGHSVTKVEQEARKGKASLEGKETVASYEGRNPLGEKKDKALSDKKEQSVSGKRIGKGEGGDIPVLVIRPLRVAAGSAPKSPNDPHAPYGESGLYEVKKGDTLWHIARRFTGDPFNYPRIAYENSIPNPDLIFPGQLFTVRVVYGGRTKEGAE